LLGSKLTSDMHPRDYESDVLPTAPRRPINYA